MLIVEKIIICFILQKKVNIKNQSLTQIQPLPILNIPITNYNVLNVSMQYFFFNWKFLIKKLKSTSTECVTDLD